MPSPTDIARWDATAKQPPSWADRNQLIASWIPPGSSVLDVGAGSMNLRGLLPSGATYVGIDVTPGAGASFVDFNAFTTPRFDRVFDYAIVSGVLEYVVDPSDVLRAVRSWARQAIVSYAPSTSADQAPARRRSGWINDLTTADLGRLFAAYGFTVAKEASWQAQRIYQLEPMAGVGLAQPTDTRPWPVSLYRADATNVGDWWSAPRRYLSSLEGADVDLFRITQDVVIDAPVIVGGGGLFHPVFDERFARVEFSKTHPVVGWGLGENTRLDLAGGWVDDGPPAIPSWTDRCDLLGVRDDGSRARWVPCASCLHPALLAPRSAVHEVVVYAHKRLPIDAEGLPYRTNDGCDIESALDFLGSGHVVVTNSYHGAYWATLLGRAVVALPFSSKFWGLRHRPVMARPNGWKRAVEFARPFPGALMECRQANNDFAALVTRTMGLSIDRRTGMASSAGPSPFPPTEGRLWRTPAEVDRGLAALGVAATQRAAIADELTTRLPAWCMRESADLPERPVPWRAVVVAAGVLPSESTLLSRVSPSARVVMLDAANPALDHLKHAIGEDWHLGVESPSGREVWCGPRADSRGPRDPDALPTVVSFYTVGTPYADEAAELEASCARAGVPCVIRGIEPRGTWEANCAAKAGFIRDLWQAGVAPLLWVDADARLHRSPELLRGATCDFAVHKVDGWQFASGTLFFGNTPLAGILLETWVRRCEQSPHVFDQVLLDVAWEDTMRQYPLRTMWLPAEYTLISDHAEALHCRTPPVIIHHQASRRLKQAVSTEAPPRPHPVVCDDWRRARRASRAWVDASGLPQAGRAVLSPDYIPFPGTPTEVPRELDELERRVCHWLRGHSARAGRVGIFGASWFGCRLAARFRLAGIEPAVFLDNDTHRHPEDLVGIPVVAPLPIVLEQLDTMVIASAADTDAIVAEVRAHVGANVTMLVPRPFRGSAPDAPAPRRIA